MGAGTNGTTISHTTHHIAIVSGRGNPESPGKKADRRPSGLWFTRRATYPKSWPSLPRGNKDQRVSEDWEVTSHVNPTGHVRQLNRH